MTGKQRESSQGSAVLTVVGIGPGPHDLLTVRGRRRLRQAQVVFCTPETPAAVIGEAAEDAEVSHVRQVFGNECADLVASRARMGASMVWLASGDGHRCFCELRELLAGQDLVLELVPGPTIAAVQPVLPLMGKRVLVTRAWHQSAQTCRLLESAGAIAIAMPTIQIDVPADQEAIRQAIAQLGHYRWLILTSANGVGPLGLALQGAGLDARALAGLQVCAIGPATAKRLQDIGLRADRVAADYRAEGLLELLPQAEVGGARVLVWRAAEARDILPDTLRERGARVDVVPAYVTTLPPEGQWRTGVTVLETGGADAVMFTSASTVRHFARIVGARCAALLSRVAVAAIGPITAAACQEVGIGVDVMPSEYTLPALVASMATYYRRINNAT